MSKVTRGRKKKAAALIILAALAAFIWSPFSNYGISLAVMKVYSGINERDSVMAEKGFDIEIPGGGATEEKDWYPFVMTYNPKEAFGRFTGEPALELSIMYNFPAFDMAKGCSRIYDPDSKYYNGFYGAYAVSGETSEGVPYGFDADGGLEVERAAQVPEFDFKKLVLGDMGIDASDMIFDWSVDAVSEKESYAGSAGWTRVDASLTVNGVYHHRKEFHRNYLQYGSPDFEHDGEDFEPVDMKGRIYAKYFDEYDCGVFFYILAADEGVLKACDEQILSESVIKKAD